MRVLLTLFVALLIVLPLLLGLSSPEAVEPSALTEQVATDGNLINRPVSYTIQGDSLEVASLNYFVETRPNWRLASFSAKGGRRVSEAWQKLQSQQLGQVVVFALGTNDWSESPDKFDRYLTKVIDYIGPERCLVMATIYDRRPIPDLNQIIAQRAAELGPARMQLVYWDRAVQLGQVRLADGVHPGTRQGNRFRTRMIIEAIERCMVSQDEA